jgi:ubiquinone/menaquinone biosynthesis C-methylase UbiE
VHCTSPLSVKTMHYLELDDSSDCSDEYYYDDQSLIEVSTMPDHDTHTDHIQAQFTRQAQAYANTEQARDLGSMASLVGLTNVDQNSITLDVACGPGRFTMAFAKCTKHAIGFDATEALLGIARSESAELGIENIEFRQGSALELPFSEGAFDVVSCRAAFHHFDKPDVVISEMARVTKTGGQLLIADILGNEDEATGQRHDNLERLCDPTHVRCLPAKEFNALFDSVSLKIAKSLQNVMSYDVNGWIVHGGPTPNVEAEIRRVFQKDLKQNQTGLDVREENGELMFSHQTVVYLLEK